jgi:hypothetical protein
VIALPFDESDQPDQQVGGFHAENELCRLQQGCKRPAAVG